MANTLQTAGLPWQDARKHPTAAVLTALGVVYGDIGTSTLYALKQAVQTGGTPTPDTVMGIVSVILWSLLPISRLRDRAPGPGLPEPRNTRPGDWRIRHRRLDVDGGHDGAGGPRRPEMGLQPALVRSGEWIHSDHRADLRCGEHDEAGRCVP